MFYSCWCYVCYICCGKKLLLVWKITDWTSIKFLSFQDVSTGCLPFGGWLTTVWQSTGHITLYAPFIAELFTYDTKYSSIFDSLYHPLHLFQQNVLFSEVLVSFAVPLMVLTVKLSSWQFGAEREKNIQF